jgi:hypothetical protein
MYPKQHKIKVRFCVYSEYVAEKVLVLSNLQNSLSVQQAHYLTKEKRLKKMISFKGLVLGKEVVCFIFQHIFCFLYAE